MFPLEFRSESGAQLLHPEPDTGLHGAKGLRQPLGDLLLGEATEIGELYDLALLGRDLRQRGQNETALVRKLGGERRVVLI